MEIDTLETFLLFLSGETLLAIVHDLDEILDKGGFSLEDNFDLVQISDYTSKLARELV